MQARFADRTTFGNSINPTTEAPFYRPVLIRHLRHQLRALVAPNVCGKVFVIPCHSEPIVWRSAFVYDNEAPYSTIYGLCWQKDKTRKNYAYLANQEAKWRVLSDRMETLMHAGMDRTEVFVTFRLVFDRLRTPALTTHPGKSRNMSVL